MLEIDKVRVTITPRKRGNMRAQATIEQDNISINGYMVMYKPEEDKYYVLPPSRQLENGKHISIVWIRDQQLWSDIQEMIIYEFHNTFKDDPNEDSFNDLEKDSDKNVDPLDLPF